MMEKAALVGSELPVIRGVQGRSWVGYRRREFSLITNVRGSKEISVSKFHLPLLCLFEVPLCNFEVIWGMHLNSPVPCGYISTFLNLMNIH